jgi:hypothetical protein
VYYYRVTHRVFDVPTHYWRETAAHSSQLSQVADK